MLVICRVRAEYTSDGRSEEELPATQENPEGILFPAFPGGCVLGAA
jgi:hypothetical protein